MKSLRGFVLLAGFLLVGCGGTTIATSRQFDDASTTSTGGTGGTPSSGGGNGASGGLAGAAGTTGGRGATIGSTGGTTTVTDAGVGGRSTVDAGLCSGNPLVTNVMQGGVSDVPSDGCGSLGSPTAPTCVGTLVTFSCPVIRGPGDSGTIRPGDQITVTVVARSEGFVNYPCFGLVADHGVMGGANLLYALPAAGWGFSVRIPPSLTPGTVVHFTAYVRSASSLNSGACPNRLGKLDFDVTVG